MRMVWLASLVAVMLMMGEAGWGQENPSRPGLSSAGGTEPSSRPSPGVPGEGGRRGRGGRWMRERSVLVVTGKGEVAAAPDRAVVRLGVTAQAAQAAEAQGRVNEVVGRMVDALKELGVKGEEISTAGVSLSPVYSQPTPREAQQGEGFTPKVTAYRAENTVEVRLMDLKKVGPAIDAAVGAGANRVESLAFDLKDDAAAKGRALEEAVKQARAKAEALAQATGVKLGELQEMVEGGTEAPPIPYRGGAMRAMAAAVPTPIEPGEMRVRGEVTVRYGVGR